MNYVFGVLYGLGVVTSQILEQRENEFPVFQK
jgi:hypothetical protein